LAYVAETPAKTSNIQELRMFESGTVKVGQNLLGKYLSETADLHPD